MALSAVRVQCARFGNLIVGSVPVEQQVTGREALKSGSVDAAVIACFQYGMCRQITRNAHNLTRLQPQELV
ncbi:MAG: hypothetical protein AAGD11_21025, partial [Planctomycetota bacterium]